MVFGPSAKDICDLYHQNEIWRLNSQHPDLTVSEELEKSRRKWVELKGNLKSCKDKDLVIAIVKRNGFMLKFVSAEFKDDFDVVFTAVSQCGNALQWASTEQKDHKPTVLAALKQDSRAAKFASRKLQLDRDILVTQFEQSRIQKHSFPTAVCRTSSVTNYCGYD